MYIVDYAYLCASSFILIWFQCFMYGLTRHLSLRLKHAEAAMVTFTNISECGAQSRPFFIDNPRSDNMLCCSALNNENTVYAIEKNISDEF